MGSSSEIYEYGNNHKQKLQQYHQQQHINPNPNAIVVGGNRLIHKFNSIKQTEVYEASDIESNNSWMDGMSSDSDLEDDEKQQYYKKNKDKQTTIQTQPQLFHQLPKVTKPKNLN